MCNWLINRRILKTKFQMQPYSAETIATMQQKAAVHLSISPEEAGLFVFDGVATNSMYNTGNEHIKILFKDGTVKDISEIEYVLIKLVADGPAKKFYLCHPGDLS